MSKIKLREENLLFWKRLIKNPRTIGALFPSSKSLAKMICRHVDDSGYVLELGPGTGRFTRVLIKSGLDLSNFFTIEMDKELVTFLQKSLPQVKTLHANATYLNEILPSEVIGNVSTIISGIPLINLSYQQQCNLANACFQVLKPNGRLLQFTYGPTSPLPAKDLGLYKKCLGHVLLNFPPAIIWGYTKIPLLHWKT